MNAKYGLPYPWLSLALVIVWQLLINAPSVGSLVLGLVLGWGIPLLTRAFWPNPPTLVRPGVLLRLLLRVLWDIVVANLQMARLILGSNQRLRPAFIEYPLTLRHEFAISLLASAISLTPGTVSADISEDRGTLLIHALDVDDEQALIGIIRQRYEQPLREAFECSSPS